MCLRPLLIALVPALLVSAGCAPKPLNESKTLTLDKEVPARGLAIPARKQPTKVTVEFTSSDGDVTVLLFKDADVPDDDSMSMVIPNKALEKKRGKSGSFTVDVPENTATRVVVREHTAAKTDVAVKVTGTP